MTFSCWRGRNHLSHLVISTHTNRAMTASCGFSGRDNRWERWFASSPLGGVSHD